MTERRLEAHGKPNEGILRLAESLNSAWRKYSELFGEPPHGTIKQLTAMLTLSPQIKEYVRLYEEQRERMLTE